MLQTEGQNPDTLLNRLNHHAANAVPLVDACLRNLLLRCPLAFDNRRHRISQRKVGANSFALLLEDGCEYHFRALPEERYKVIHVKDHFKNGREVATLRTEDDVRSFFEALRVEGSTETVGS